MQQAAIELEQVIVFGAMMTAEMAGTYESLAADGSCTGSVETTPDGDVIVKGSCTRET